jgi:hypothetical protein
MHIKTLALLAMLGGAYADHYLHSEYVNEHTGDIIQLLVEGYTGPV